MIRRITWRQLIELPGQSALDATQVESRAAQDFGGLARPWRNRTQPWHHPQRGRLRCAVLRLQHGKQTLAQHAVGRAVHVEKVDVPSGSHAHAVMRRFKTGIESFEAK